MMFPKKGKRAPADTVKGMIGILDKVFSEYVRRRDSNSGEYGACITCGQVFHWKEAHAGHYVTRNYYSTRWNENNVNLQCFKCNCTRGGEQGLHGIAIDKKYGKGTAEMLQAISRMPSIIDREWLSFHIKFYREKIKKMKK
jgi:Bacteriophage Lambda NinG protein